MLNTAGRDDYITISRVELLLATVAGWVAQHLVWSFFLFLFAYCLLQRSVPSTSESDRSNDRKGAAAAAALPLPG